MQIILYEKMREMLEAGTMPKDFSKNSDHYANFLLAFRGDEEPYSPFSVSGLRSQMLALARVANCNSDFAELWASFLRLLGHSPENELRSYCNVNCFP
ncbi:MAG TPA: hypothetical protein DCR55_10555 [Lentisphaeria bacterium]|nr:hypothetical protein [Lentisphaeria bacterium]